MTDLMNMISGLLVLVLVLLLAWLCSRFLGKRMAYRTKSKYMNVVDQITVGQDRQVVILKVKDETFLVGSSPAGIELLTKLEGEYEEDDGTPSNVDKESFKSYLARYRETLSGKDKKN
jgi:flagellar protein FliO/FliZ